jgi:hypothetical protein
MSLQQQNPGTRCGARKGETYMRIRRIATISIAAAFLAAAFGSASLSGQSRNDATTGKTLSTESKAANNQARAPVKATPFAALARVKAEPMTRDELKTVKGLHVHFDDGADGVNIHLAGDVHSGNFTNWENRGGSDGLPVAPSYNGLCVAQGVGVGGINIPGAAVQCP